MLCLGTAYADYYLVAPAKEYERNMSLMTEKIYMSKVSYHIRRLLYHDVVRLLYHDVVRLLYHGVVRLLYHGVVRLLYHDVITVCALLFSLFFFFFKYLS